ncbi:YHS domain-containing (seleno)protein [Litorimonas haliclonae]|uniref:YHS domain-containing (seleno)protein n=1 Tax=Litorimonas haliclonae TaxID=2081977 RepID=UPI0039EF7E67
MTAAPMAYAGGSPVYTGTFSNDALQGYDAVAYFKQGEAVEGSKDFSTDYNGAEWKFSSQANLDAFLETPDKYAPQYGGYCAWAAAQGKTAKGDAKHWRIVDNKLYLNYNADIQSKWDKDRSAFITKADAKWPDLIK